MELFKWIYLWFLLLPGYVKQEIVVTLAAIAWLIYYIDRSRKKTKTSRTPEKKGFQGRKFKSDGSYWDPKDNKWIGPDYEYIPSDYHWDDIACRWVPPNHPDHPKYHMNDKPLEEQGRGAPVRRQVRINRDHPTYEEWKAQREKDNTPGAGS